MATEHKIRISAVDSASAVFARLGRSTRTSIAGMNDLNGSSKVLSKNLGGVVSQLAGATAGIVGFTVVIGQMRKALDTVAEFQKSDSLLSGILGSPEEGAKGFEFLKKVANEYGIVLNSLAHNYARFSASSKFAGLTTKQTEETFTKLSRAVRGLNLDGEQTRGVFQAIDQMLSKGKVSAEELRQQLAERIPNALGLASKSLGISMDELDKRLKAGAIVTSDFILPFIDELDQAYGKLANTTKDQLSASFARATNAVQLFYKTIITDKTLENVTKILNSFVTLLNELGPSVAVLVQHMTTLTEVFLRLASENGIATQFAVALAGVLAFNKALSITKVLYSSISTKAVPKYVVGRSGALSGKAGALGGVAEASFTASEIYSGRRKDKLGHKVIDHINVDRVTPYATNSTAKEVRDYYNLRAKENEISRSPRFPKGTNLNAIDALVGTSVLKESKSFFKGLFETAKTSAPAFASRLVPVVIPLVLAGLATAGIVKIVELNKEKQKERDSIATGIGAEAVTKYALGLREQGTLNQKTKDVVSFFEKGLDSTKKAIKDQERYRILQASEKGEPETLALIDRKLIELKAKEAFITAKLIEFKEELQESDQLEAISNKKINELKKAQREALEKLTADYNSEALQKQKDTELAKTLGIETKSLNDKMRAFADGLKEAGFQGLEYAKILREGIQAERILQEARAKATKESVDQFIESTEKRKNQGAIDKIFGSDLGKLATDLLGQGYKPTEIADNLQGINKQRKADELAQSRDEYLKAYRENINKLKTETSFRNRFNGQFSEIFNVGEKYRDAIRDGLLTNAEGAKYFKNELNAGRVREIANVEQFGRVDANDAFFKARQESSLRGIKPVGGTEQDAIKAILESFKDEKVAKVDEKVDRKKQIDVLTSIDNSLKNLKVK